MPSACQCAGYTALCAVALLGFATILVMVLIPDVRANLSFRPSSCEVFKSGTEYMNETGQQRPFLDVRGINLPLDFSLSSLLQVTYARDDGTNETGVAYPTLDCSFSSQNTSQFLVDYQVRSPPFENSSPY